MRARCADVKPAGYQGTHAVEAASAGQEGAGLVDVPMYQTRCAGAPRAVAAAHP